MQGRKLRILGTILVVILVLTGLLGAGCGGTEEASTTTAIAPATTAGPATTTAPPTTAGPATTTAPPTTAGPAQEAMKLTFSFGGPNKGAFAETNQWFVDEIAKRSGDMIKTEITWGGTLIAQADTLSGVGKGVADMGSAMGTTAEANWTTLSLSGAGMDAWAMMMATHDMVNNNPAIVAEFTKANVVPTIGYFPGTPIMILKKELKTIDDIKGLRIRVGTPDEGTAMGAIGLEPVQLGIMEIYESLDKGVIDGCLLTVSWADTLKLGEVAKYWYRFENNMLGGAVTNVINADVWAKFTPETQGLIKQVALEYSDKYTKTVIDLEAQVLEQAKTGLNVQYLMVPADIDAAYRAAITKAHDDWFAKYLAEGKDVKQVWDEYQGLVQKYQTQVAEKGYPWAPK
jgi:TRAP-type transport system periplasmic protein